MTAQDHLAIALQFREIAHELLRRNQSVAAGEMLWGAANRIILAINLQHATIPAGHTPTLEGAAGISAATGPAGRPVRRNTVVRHLDAQYQNIPTLRQGIAAVGRLHGHFYNSDLPAERLTAFIHDAETFISALFNLPETRIILQA